MRKTCPIIVRANRFQFASRQCSGSPRVNSRMVLWCKSGSGRVWVNGRECLFQTDDLCLTPWAHKIDYEADPRNPFLLAGIHVIPHQPMGTRLVGDASHQPGDEPDRLATHCDARWQGLEGLKCARFAGDAPLQALCEYIVRLCHDGKPRESKLRNLAVLLVDELKRFFCKPPADHGRMPIDLQRVVQYIEDHLSEDIYLPKAAQISGRSLSWLHRQFRQALDTTPMEFITATRIKRARMLLATGSLRVAEVGQAVGIGDPYYFSKLFKSRVNVSPLAYRKRASLF
jgi:AraC-like DNA-binding protein